MKLNPLNYKGRRGKIVVVVGAGHMNGIQRWLACSEVEILPEERLKEISSSSRHEITWPGNGVFPVLNTQALFHQEGSKPA